MKIFTNAHRATLTYALSACFVPCKTLQYDERTDGLPENCFDELSNSGLRQIINRDCPTAQPILSFRHDTDSGIQGYSLPRRHDGLSLPRLVKGRSGTLFRFPQPQRRTGLARRDDGKGTTPHAAVLSARSLSRRHGKG